MNCSQRFLVVILLCFFLPMAKAAAFATIPADGIPWSFSETKDGFVAIGDLHGDVDAFREILRDRQLIDQQDHWTGRTVQLVLMGDLIDRGDQSREVMDLAIQLQAEARDAGGAVHALLGNHEAMVTAGDYRFVSAQDNSRLRDLGGITKAYVGETLYARWIASRNSIIRIGSTLFTHAGLEDWGAADPASINSSVRAWLRFDQGRGPQPPSETEWVRQRSGPFWSMALAHGGTEKGLARRSLDVLLSRYKVARVIVGHFEVPSVDSINPEYGDRVIFIDTGISRASQGVLSSVGGQGRKIDGREFSRSRGTTDHEDPSVRSWSTDDGAWSRPRTCSRVF